MTQLPKLLIVDDQPDNLDVLVSYLAEANLQLSVATCGEDALQLASQHQPDLILLDVMMPGIDGYETCRRLKQLPQGSKTPVIFMSALSDPQHRVKGFQAGAIDYVTKPLHRQEVLARIQAQLTIQQQQRELLQRNQQLQALNQELQAQIDKRQQAEAALNTSQNTLSALTRQEAERWGLDAFVGQSQRMLELLEQLRSLQQAPDTNVLVLGESGTGKELVSRAIHYGSQRSAKPFIAVNCAAIPAELADAEFFGHTRGAFTGAINDRTGYFEQANGGTLFLDEIGDMPLGLQTKLLRVLEDGLLTPIGSNKQKQVNVRVVAATNVNLQQRVNRQEFRQDLYFRLAGYRMELPPLRERMNDIPLLVNHFISTLGRQMGRQREQADTPSSAISPEAMQAIQSYGFPGNVRELRNMIEFALIASRGQCITRRHLNFVEAPSEAVTQGDAQESAIDVRSVQTAASPRRAHPVSGQGPGSGSAFSPLGTQMDNDEAMLLDFVRHNDRINNATAQQLLDVDHGRASYLLKKLHKEGKLSKQGERRWSYYVLPEA
ncbi:sigma-54-dependent transcriptional regulator [Oceanobacter kriegii]|uniref:sigma-54-dependent transcriptional regulator n=1 Tax=Oceanobacter kriegii TaxID=64972 RepID=UPI000416A3E8|nr:sigma-54 dependent transcriptional regulator [Oceanobacter kriegii]